MLYNTQKQPSNGAAWVNKVRKSKVAAKNGCNDVNANKFQQ